MDGTEPSSDATIRGPKRSDPWGNPPPARERRQQRRLPYSQAVSVAWLEDDDSNAAVHRVIAEDISTGGIRMVGPVAFRPGALGIIRLNRADGSYGLVGVAIVHTRAMSDFLNAAGAKFISLPKELEAHQLVGVEARLRSLEPIRASA